MRLPTVSGQCDLLYRDSVSLPSRDDDLDVYPSGFQGSKELIFVMTAPLAHPTPDVWLIADMQQAQLLMVAGFVMLGWVLARRQIRMRKRVNRDARAANKAIQQIRDHKEPAVPLCDAPAETQRWQAAMFDLQRELKAELDTRIVVVQTLLNQVDQRIEQLALLQGAVPTVPGKAAAPSIVSATDQQVVADLHRSGHTAGEIASQTGLPVGDIEFTISTLGPN